MHILIGFFLKKYLYLNKKKNKIFTYPYIWNTYIFLHNNTAILKLISYMLNVNRFWELRQPEAISVL